MAADYSHGRSSVFIRRPPPNGEPYPLSPLVLTSLIVLVYSVAVMPLFTSARQSVGALSALSRQAGQARALSQVSAQPSSKASVKPQNQFQFSWDSILANIGQPAGAAPGAVIASPSKKDPNYFYTWTRDSALTISSLLPGVLPSKYLRPWDPLPSSGDGDMKSAYTSLLREYISAQAQLQVTPNPSGDLWSGGLSEPKFNTDLTAFTGSWGRPQRDGPALRSLSLIPYASYLLEHDGADGESYVRSMLYNSNAIRAPNSTIKNDLEEVAERWYLPCFDIWEELEGRHFYTDFMSWRSLQAGGHFSRLMGDPGAADWYAAKSAEVAPALPSYWNASLGAYVSSDAEALQNAHREGLDAQVLLAFVHAGDSLARGAWSPASPRVLSTLRAYVTSFEGLYKINPAEPWTQGWLVGRYKEDVYDGVGMSKANPWFICTHAVSTVLYVAQAQLATAGSITVTADSRAFWTDVLGKEVQEGTWTKGGTDFDTAITSLGSVADNFAARAAEYYDKGHMAEQIQRNTGQQTGARDLTWSYASFLEQERARDAAKRASA